MMVRVPSAALFPNERRPKQQQNRNQPDRAKDYEPFVNSWPYGGQHVSRLHVGQEN
jgi:hypothetical protein